jgi:hypothetical protein
MGRRVSKVLELLTPDDPITAEAVADGYQPFPVHALPAPVGTFVREGASALGCDEACLALPVLAVLAAAVGNSRTIRLKDGSEEPCVIWSAVVGDGGVPAGAALRTALAHLLSRQKEAFLTFRWMRKLYEQAQKDLQDRLKRATDIWAEMSEKPQKAPTLERFACSQTAVDTLAALLEENPRGLLLAREELDGWLASFLRSSVSVERDPLLWQEMHRAGSIYVERTRGDRRLCFVPRAAMSLTGVLSPGMLSRVVKAGGPAGGLVACFLVAMPPRLPRVWSPAGIAEAAERAFNELVDRLLKLELDDRGDERVPHVLSLSKTATAAWVEFYNTRGAEQAVVEGVLAAALGRTEMYAARFALIDHVVRCVEKDPADPAAVGSCRIEPRSIKAGVTLARWFAAETRRVYAKLLESAAERNAAALVALIRQRGGRIAVRELMRTSSRYYPDVATAEAALARLVELGLGRWTESRQKKLTA